MLTFCSGSVNIWWWKKRWCWGTWRVYEVLVARESVWNKILYDYFSDLNLLSKQFNLQRGNMHLADPKFAKYICPWGWLWLIDWSIVWLKKLLKGADTFLRTRQEISRVFWNPKFHNRVHKTPPALRILSQMNAVQDLPFHLRWWFSYYLPLTPTYSQVFLPPVFHTVTD
jgi:hypothetical protein